MAALAWWLVSAWLLLSLLATAGCAWTLRLLARTQPWPVAWSPILVVSPVRGAENLPAYLAALAAQDHPDWRVAFAVEAEVDAAFPVLARFVAADPARRSLVVAGPTSQRAQKVHNQLAALAALRPDDLAVVTLDADMLPPPDLLRALLRPIETNQSAISSGYRWTLPGIGTGLAARLLSLVEIAIATLPRCARCNLCWGGATAIRRDALDLPTVWDRAVTDDLVLTRAARAAGLVIYAPLTVRPPTRFAGRAVDFGARQYRLLRLHAPWVWGFAGGCLGLAALGGGAAMLLAASGHSAAWLALGAAIGLQAARAAIRSAIARRVLPDAAARLSASVLRWAPLLAPATLVLHLAAWGRSLGGSGFDWAGRHYRLDAAARVVAVEPHSR